MKFDTTKVEIDDKKFLSCLPVAPLVMEATVGGSGGIPLDPSLETGRDEEEKLKRWRLKFQTIQETGTALE